MMKPQEINKSKKALARTKSRMRVKCYKKHESGISGKITIDFNVGFNSGWNECIRAIERRKKLILKK